jgi:hypothetical protein
MIDPRHGRAELSDQDLAIAALVGRYVERREHNQSPCARDLFAAAAELGDVAVDVLRTVIACYEAMRAWDTEDTSPRASQAAGGGQRGSTS